MDRARKVEPRSNKLLYEAELRFRKECHDRKLRAVKASVDNKAPKGFGEARRNLKKEMILEEHYSKIEHQNRLLLSKMSDIMTRPMGGGAAPGAGGVDNVCIAWEYGRSMNSRNRKAEMERINSANKREADNIRKVEPMYNHHEWDEHAAVAEKLALQITEYQKLPIGAEKRAARSPRMGSSFVGGASGGRGLGGSRLSMSRLGGGNGEQHQQHLEFGSGSSEALPGGMALNPSSSFIAGGGLAGFKGDGSGVGGGSFHLPGLSHGLSSESGSTSQAHISGAGPGFMGVGGGSGFPPQSAGGARMGLATPGGTALGSLGPSAAALLAKYGYSSVLTGGSMPSGGSSVPTVLGGATGAYPMVSGHPT